MRTTNLIQKLVNLNLIQNAKQVTNNVKYAYMLNSQKIYNFMSKE